jgi:hydroxypyruvate isomerase
MAKLSVCIEMFWPGEPPEDKIAKCGALGCKALEFWGWKDKNLTVMSKAVKKENANIVVFGMQADKSLVDFSAQESLRDGLTQSIVIAKQLGCNQLIVTSGKRQKESFEVTRRTVIRNLKAMEPILRKNKTTLCLEPLNPVVDHPDSWLTRMSDAADICSEVDSPWIKILMDIYHQQVTEGNIITMIQQYAPLIGHFHAAGVPGRHELVGGDLDYRSIFRVIDEAGYSGYIGLEFSPIRDTEFALKEAFSLIESP